MKLSAAAMLGWTVLAGSAWADVRLDGRPIQGGLIVGQASSGADVRLDGHQIRVGSDGLFVFGFGREAKPISRLEVRHADGRVETRTLKVEQRRYDIQRIDGLPPDTVTPPPALAERIRRENEMIATARATDSNDPLFLSGWIWPAIGPVSGVYGSQRVLNGQPRAPHYGLDIAAPEGADVLASTDGVVLIAAPELYLTGGTIVIDHGFGLTAAYSHLKEVMVAVGQSVRQGQVIGKVGATGRASGPHLDWRVNWFGERLDPQRLLPPGPQ